MSEQKPSIGRIVHYYNLSLPEIGPYAAIITDVVEDDEADTINLFHFGRNGEIDRGGCNIAVPAKDKAPEGAGAYWEFPPRI